MNDLEYYITMYIVPCSCPGYPKYSEFFFNFMWFVLYIYTYTCVYIILYTHRYAMVVEFGSFRTLCALMCKIYKQDKFSV